MRSPVEQVRLKHKLSQEQLAALADVSQALISRVKRGFADIPETLLKAFSDMGEDTDKLIERHHRFMREIKRDLKKSVHAAK